MGETNSLWVSVEKTGPEAISNLLHSAWRNTSEDLHLYHIHCEDTKSQIVGTSI